MSDVRRLVVRTSGHGLVETDHGYQLYSALCARVPILHELDDLQVAPLIGSRHGRDLRVDDPAACPEPMRRPVSRTIELDATFALSQSYPLCSTVDVCEAFRAAMIARADGCLSVSGHGRQPSDHKHAFFIPVIAGNRVTAVRVYAKRASPAAVGAALVLQRVTIGGRPVAATLVDAQSDWPEARSYRSVTPFVATTHGKLTKSGVRKIDEHGHWVGGPEWDAARMAERHLGQRPVVERVEASWDRWTIARRRGGGRRGHHPPVGLRLVFERSVRGPVCLGYGAHVGLGYFVPEESS